MTTCVKTDGTSMVPALSLFVICAVCVGAVSLSPIGCGVAASTARYHSHSKRHINIRASGASDAGSEIAPMLQHSRRLRAFTRLWRLRGGNATTAPPNSSSSTGQTAALANTGSKATGDGETARQPSVVAKDISSSISNITASERASLLLRARVQAAAYLMQIRTQEAIAGRMAGNVTNLVPYVQRLSQLFLDTAFPPPGNIDAENTAMSQLRLVQPFRPLEISNSTIEALSIDDRAALELDMKSTLISIIAPTFYKSLSALQTGIYSNFDAGVRDMVASGHYSAASAQALISALLEAFDASTGNIRNGNNYFYFPTFVLFNFCAIFSCVGYCYERVDPVSLPVHVCGLETLLPNRCYPLLMEVAIRGRFAN